MNRRSKDSKACTFINKITKTINIQSFKSTRIPNNNTKFSISFHQQYKKIKYNNFQIETINV